MTVRVAAGAPGATAGPDSVAFMGAMGMQMQGAQARTPAWRGRERLHRRVYPFRILGLALGGLPGVVGLHEGVAPAWQWWVLGLICLGWPHLAWWRAQRSARPYSREVGNLLFDSFLAGVVGALAQFNPLACAVLLTVALVDKISSGVRGLWLLSLPWTLAGLVFGGVLTGYRVDLETSLAMVLACLPTLLIHVVATSVYASHLMRKVHRQNRALDELSSVDLLTRVLARHRWEEHASAALQAVRNHGRTASLVIFDVDRFKPINDAYGHAVGDDTLAMIARVLSQVFVQPACLGRLGGDEFVVVLPADTVEAKLLAEAAREQVSLQQIEAAPELRCTISCGLAQAQADMRSLRDWLVAADQALYRAKRGGRDRVDVHGVPETRSP